ncbi:MAG: VWA domain-containing protein, partial [Planctomycetota bacterium]
MSFLTPWVAAIVAAIVVPALVILYFLKLRRREQIVPSTFLWRRAVREMQVNAPFQRLRRNLLLLLQLLVLAAGILALARPIVRTSLSDAQRVVILIDRSASMNTLEDGGRTRLDLAKEQATRLVRTFNQVGSRWMALFSGVESLTRVMVIAFSDRATVVTPFTTNIPDVVDRIESVEPTDGRTNIREALELAEAYMQQTRLEQTVETAETASSLVLYSDGGVPALDDLTLRAERVQYVPIGTTEDNVGITAFRAERNYEEPEQFAAFLQVRNFGAEPVRTDVSILVDGRLQTVREVSLDAAQRRGSAEPGEGESGPGAEAALSFEFPLPESAVVTARVVRADGLAADNEASIVAPAPRKLRVLLVSAKNFFLERALRFLPLEEFQYLTPEQYESAPEGQIAENGRSRFDVVVFDKHDTARLPRGNYLFIASSPQIEGVGLREPISYHAMMWWDETHPILRHVALEHVLIAKAAPLDLPADAQKLAEGPDGPELARLVRDGRQYLLLGFAFEDSTWWG